MRVLYLYDHEDWAIHNVGKTLVQPAAAHGVRVECLAADEFHRSPRRADVLYFGYSWLRQPARDYRTFAEAVVATVHDPMEISNFRHRHDWARLPLVPFDFSSFHRVSTTSTEMHAVFRERYGVDTYLTPTFPHDHERLLQMPSGHAGDDVRAVTFTASVAGGAYEPWHAVRQRLRYWRGYTRDERGRLSPRQMTTLLARKRRKNIPLLERIGRHVERRQGCCDFRLMDSASVAPRDEYVKRLGSADVYVCTSFMEGGPLPVMEAVLAGLAVLTTRVGQTPHWVSHGHNGYFCQTYGEFRDAVDAYLDRPDLLAAHQAHSRQLGATRTFDVSRWIDFLTGRSPA